MLDGTGVALHTDAVAAEGLLPIDVGSVPIALHDPFLQRHLRAARSRRPLHPQGRAGRAGAHGRWSGARLAFGHRRPCRHRRHGRRRRHHGRRDARGGGRASGRSGTASSSASSAEIPDSHLNGHSEQRLPGNAHFRFDGVEGEAMVLSLTRRRRRRGDRLGVQLEDPRALAHPHLLRAPPRGGARLARVHLRPLQPRRRRRPHHGGAAAGHRAPAGALAALPHQGLSRSPHDGEGLT